MKVAIDSSPTRSGHKFRGVGIYTIELFSALEKIAKKRKDFRVSLVDFEKEDLNDFDILHLPYFSPYDLTIPKVQGRKIVVTIHDLIPLIYPRNYPPGLKGKINFFLQKRRLKDIDFVITDSECSKKDIVRFLNIESRKIEVIYLAPRSFFCEMKDIKALNWVRKKYNLPSKFVLYVGDVNYSKNLISLVRAVNILKMPLVICGKGATNLEEVLDFQRVLSFKTPRNILRYLLGIPHPELMHLIELRDEIERSPNVIRLGFVPDEDLVAIYNLASVYCQPSFYEGFGLPPLEAITCGCPVVVAKTNALVEVFKDVSLVADPKNPEDIAEKILILLGKLDLRAKLIKEAKKRVEEFSWEKTAEKTFQVYKRLMH